MITESAYANARQLLFLLPEEIFKLWFDERIKANGWPPNQGVWQGTLRDKSIQYWTKLHWEKTLMKLDYNLLTNSSKEIIEGLIEANFHNKINDYSLLLNDSMSRIKSIIDYFKKYSKLPSPLILIYENRKYEIIDGSHRIAVFFFLQSICKNNIKLNNEHESWIGKIK